MKTKSDYILYCQAFDRRATLSLILSHFPHNSCTATCDLLVVTSSNKVSSPPEPIITCCQAEHRGQILLDILWE